MDTLYFGARPSRSLTQALEKVGHRLVHASYKDGILSSVSTAAVVLHWKSRKDQRVIEEAKSLGLPVLVITSKLAAALQAGEPQAEIYLEHSADPEEVAPLLMDLIAAKQNPGRADSAAAQIA